MNTINKDICFYLLQFVDTKDIYSLIRVNKFFNWLVQRKYSYVNSWKKVKKEIGKGNYYALILAQKYREFSLNDCLYAACRGGSLTLVKEMLKRGADDITYGLYKASKGGHFCVLNYIIKEKKLHADYKSYWKEYAIEGACIGGHEYIVEKIIEWHYTTIDYGYFVEGAFIGNNIQFLKYIEHRISSKDWNSALFGASYNNSLSLVNLALEKGATYMQSALHGACLGGHLDLIKNLVSNYSYEWNWNKALVYVCRGGYENIINYIMDSYKCDVNYGLAGACYSGKLETIGYMISKGANGWGRALKKACRGRKLHIVKMICEEKIEHLTEENVEKCISLYAKNEETKKYLASVLQKMK